jgi:hypothetical protein
MDGPFYVQVLAEARERYGKPDIFNSDHGDSKNIVLTKIASTINQTGFSIKYPTTTCRAYQV